MMLKATSHPQLSARRVRQHASLCVLIRMHGSRWVASPLGTDVIHLILLQKCEGFKTFDEVALQEHTKVGKQKYAGVKKHHSTNSSALNGSRYNVAVIKRSGHKMMSWIELV